MEGATRETTERLLFGITTIMLRCGTCGELKTVEIKGDARIAK